MALNTRGMDPRFAAHNARAVVGWMGAQVEVYRVSTPGTGTPTWDPLNDGTKLSPVPTQERTLIYRGPGRVQPNKDWRARLMEWEGQVITTHAVRIQIAFAGNKLIPNTFPLIGAQDEVEVSSVHGFKVPDESLSLTKLVYTIRNIPESSNAWQKTLLCDVTMNQVSDG